MAKILVADSEPMVRSVLRKALEYAGHEVVDAGDGQAVVQAVVASSPDVLVMDLLMPGVLGPPAMTEVQELRPELLIMAITGGGADRRPYLPSSMTCYGVSTMVKPFRLADFIRAVDALVRSSERCTGTPTEPEEGQRSAGHMVGRSAEVR